MEANVEAVLRSFDVFYDHVDVLFFNGKLPFIHWTQSCHQFALRIYMQSHKGFMMRVL